MALSIRRMKGSDWSVHKLESAAAFTKPVSADSLSTCCWPSSAPAAASSGDGAAKAGAGACVGGVLGLGRNCFAKVGQSSVAFEGSAPSPKGIVKEMTYQWTSTVPAVGGPLRCRLALSETVSVMDTPPIVVPKETPTPTPISTSK